MTRRLLLTLTLLVAGCGQASHLETPSAPGVRARGESASATLKPGWNGVAFPFEQLTSLQVTGPVTALATWDGTNYVLGPPTPATVNAVDGGRRGFWVLTEGDASLTFAGGDDGRGSFVSLRNGWNLVAFPGPGATLKLSAEGQVLPQLQEIQSDRSYRAVDVSAPVRTDRPYWVFANGSARLSWSSPLPGASPSQTLTVAPANATVARFQTISFTASLDGRDVTREATWTSSQPSVAAVLAPGSLKGLNAGQTEVTATLNGSSARALLTVADVAPPPAVPSPSPLPSPNLVGLRQSPPELHFFHDQHPGNVTVRPLSNLGAGEVPVGVDVRPYNHALYLLTQTPAGQVNLYCVSRETGRATAVGSPAGPFLPFGTSFGMDWDPPGDRLRVTAGTGENFRLNADGALSNTDGNLPFGANVSGVGYTNNQPGLSSTTAYALETVNHRLAYSPSLGGGALTVVGEVRLGGHVLNFEAVNGFDIPVGVNVTGSGTPATAGAALAALTVGGSTSLYSLNLPDAVATNRGPIGDGTLALVGLASLPATDYGFALASTILGPNNLLRFYTGSWPFGSSQIGISNVQNGETLVGLDWRPTTGQLYALGINAGTDTGTLYRLDPRTAQATVLTAAGSVAFADGAGNPVDLPDVAAAGYGFDFIPVGTEGFRVTTSTGLNFRVTVNGTPVDGNPVFPGSNPDASLTGPAGFVGASAAAYTNNFAGATATTLYTLDGATDSLLVQAQDTITSGVSTLVARLPVDFSQVNGFDLLPNAAVGGTALAVLQVAGVSRIYRLDLTTGAVTQLGGDMTGFTVGGLTLGF